MKTDPNARVAPDYSADGYGSQFQGLNQNGDAMWCSDPGGITIREQFAKDAMVGLLSNSYDIDIPSAHILRFLGRDDETYEYVLHWPAFIAKMAVVQADALIKELNSPSSGQVEPSKETGSPY